MRRPPTTERGRRAAEHWERWRQAQRAELERLGRLRLEGEGQLPLALAPAGSEVTTQQREVFD